MFLSRAIHSKLRGDSVFFRYMFIAMALTLGLDIVNMIDRFMGAMGLRLFEIVPVLSRIISYIRITIGNLVIPGVLFYGLYVYNKSRKA